MLKEYKIKDFTFCVLAYNHDKYIVEHLESVKYLIETHGEKIKFQIIINDDCSKDRTQLLIDMWLKKNHHLFSNVIKIFNKKNLGTCLSLKNILFHLDSDYCKITAGDDVYSFENLFKSTAKYGNYDMFSGLPLGLIDGAIVNNNFDIFNMIACDVIYDKSSLLDRLKGININNAPNIVYKKKHLINKVIVSFFSKYDVVEDWPLQIAIAENEKSAKLFLDKIVYVYYRRTLGSTYIVASDRFKKDQVRLFMYLLRGEASFFRRAALKNRLWCFLSDSKLVKRIFNLAIWIYAFRVVLRINLIRKEYCSVKLNCLKHMGHYKKIKFNSLDFIEKESS